MTDPLSLSPGTMLAKPQPEHAAQNRSARDERLFKAAQALESSFLAEMLKSAGLGEARDSFGGGIGEEQFASFLVEQQADALVSRGGIGLAEQLFNVLKGRADEAL